MNIAELRKENAAKGWTEVPSSCPTRILEKICAKRSHSLMSGAPIAPSEPRGWGAVFATPALRRNEKSLEQQYRELTGGEYVPPQTLAIRMATLGLQIKAEARVIEEQRRLDEQNAAEVKALLFPWEVRN